jgi:hypothetical protein
MVFTHISRKAYAFLATVALAFVGATAPANTAPAADRFTAFAVNLDSTGPLRPGSSQVEIVINRYSPEAEATRLINTLNEKGPEKLLDAVQDLPRIGYIRTPGSLGYDLRFARKTQGEEGGDRVIVVTDRPITFFEARNRPRTIDYPFTVIELRVNKDGEGEGKMSLFTKIEADKRNNTIVLENYGTQPVLLNNVRRGSTSE